MTKSGYFMTLRKAGVSFQGSVFSFQRAGFGFLGFSFQRAAIECTLNLVPKTPTT